MRREGNTEVVSSTIITIGFVMGLLIVPATLVCYLIVLVRKKTNPGSTLADHCECRVPFYFNALYNFHQC